MENQKLVVESKLQTIIFETIPASVSLGVFIALLDLLSFFNVYRRIYLEYISPFASKDPGHFHPLTPLISLFWLLEMGKIVDRGPDIQDHFFVKQYL